MPSRFLTPAKLCLLSLIDLYTSGEIPVSARISVLSFIAFQVTLPSDHDQYHVVERLKVSSPNGLGAFIDLLGKLPSGVPGRRVADAFLLLLWELNGLDSLHVLFKRLEELVVPVSSNGQEHGVAKISRASPIGQFVRRCCVEFTRLQFSDSQILWQSFVAYRTPSYNIWASRNPDAAQQQGADQPPWANAQPIQHGGSGMEHASTEDTSLLLSFSIQQLQKLGTRAEPAVKAKLHRWINEQWDAGEQSLQHFLNFFEYWRAGQYNMALESLRRYFDYIGKGAGETKVFYQYALLHMSVLHADFEKWEESVAAMDECIATARENQDTACLNFALSWLLYLRQAHPNDGSASFQNLSQLLGGGSNEKDEITFLKAKARDSKHWSLMSSTLLEEAKIEMYSGGNANKALEHITQSLSLNVQHDLRTLMPAALLFQGASLERLGQAYLSNRTYESVKLIHGAHCPLSDRVRATCRVAYNLAEEGQYDLAIQMLSGEMATARRVLKLGQRLQAFIGLVQLKRQIHRQDLEAADASLKALQPTVASGDAEIAFELGNLAIEYLIKRQEYRQALSLANTRIAALKANPASDIAQLLHLLVLKSKVFAAGGQHARGLSIVLRAASTADRFSLIPVQTQAIGVLSEILHELGEFSAAKELAEAALPFALEAHDLKVTADLFLQLGDAHAGIAGTLAEDSSEQTQQFEVAQTNTERAWEAYGKLEDRQGKLECLIRRRQIARFYGDDTAFQLADQMYNQILADTGGAAGAAGG